MAVIAYYAMRNFLVIYRRQSLLLRICRLSDNKRAFYILYVYTRYLFARFHYAKNIWIIQSTETVHIHGTIRIYVWWKVVCTYYTYMRLIAFILIKLFLTDLNFKDYYFNLTLYALCVNNLVKSISLNFTVYYFNNCHNSDIINILVFIFMFI